MRRFARFMVAAGTAVVVAGAAAGSAAATTTQALAISHGCPGGNVCLYDSKSAFMNDKPTLTDTDVPGVHVGGVLHNVVVVNNSDKYYASEGGFEQTMFKGAVFCYYVPDTKDEQSPDTIENPADGLQVTAIASGGTTVDQRFLYKVGYCPI